MLRTGMTSDNIGFLQMLLVNTCLVNAVEEKKSRVMTRNKKNGNLIRTKCTSQLSSIRSRLMRI